MVEGVAGVNGQSSVVAVDQAPLGKECCGISVTLRTILLIGKRALSESKIDSYSIRKCFVKSTT